MESWKGNIVGIWDQSYGNLGDLQYGIFFFICYEASIGDEFIVKPGP